MNRSVRILSLVIGVLSADCVQALAEQAFVHPGMLQTRTDLEFMKKKVAAGEEPWRTAWENLRREPYSSLEFQPKPVAHVVRGPYGRPSIGDRELSSSANAGYSHALQWVITGNRVHAQKAIEILNAWSRTLWDFQDNDAKLLAAWTGHEFCNAAAILRCTDSGWKEEDVRQFKRMLLTVYYPLLKDFFPEANGNWDAAIMDTLLCIGIFCDDRAIFERAVDHFLRGPGNGGITKYIYPSGQCEESTRDQAHTQLGLGELAQACQVAWNQGVDLYGTADNRLALGIEYTAKYMMGEDVPAIGDISTQGRDKLSDIYEGVYQHYHFVRGLEMPFTKRAIEKTRAAKSWSALTLYRGPSSKASGGRSAPRASWIAPDAGALVEATAKPPADAVIVSLGESMQTALNGRTNGGWVVLSKGVHVLPAPLRVPSNVTLAGQGNATILILDPTFTTNRAGATLVNDADDLHDVVLRDFVIEGATAVRSTANAAGSSYDYVSGSGSGAVTLRPTRSDPNQDRRQRANQLSPSRAGIVFSAQREGQMRNLRFEHVTVRNCTHDGVAIRGAQQVQIAACDFSDNGSSVVPGPGLQHNLLVTHTAGCEVKDCRLDGSLRGSGFVVRESRDVTISNNEVARNFLHGIHAAESQNVRVIGNLIEGNDDSGILFDALMDGCRNIEIHSNLSRNNGGCGIEVNRITGGTLRANTLSDNARSDHLVIVSSKRINH
jgi:parallel beta-helix repeat protein